MTKTASTPMVEKIKELLLEPASSEAKPKKEREFPYRSLIGNLLYLSTHTRPDITFSVNGFSRFVERPTYGHWMPVSFGFLHLQETQETGITIGALHSDQECKIAVFQGCQRIATENGHGILRPGSPQWVIEFD